MAGAVITEGIPLARRLRQDAGRLERLLVNGRHLGRVIKLGWNFRYGWRQGLAIEDGKDEEEALAEGAKRVIAFRNTYRARAHQGVWTPPRST